MMDKNSPNFQDAVARAKEIAQKLAAAAPNHSANSSLKRPNSEDDSFNKRPAITSPTQQQQQQQQQQQPADVSNPVLRAQLIAQKINSQLGVKTSNDPLVGPLSNQLQTQEDYHIPDKYVGLIIGKGGEQIIRIQAESGCKVVISPFRADPVPGGPDPPDRIANLCGSKDTIERARRIMDDIIHRGRMAAEGGGYGPSAYSMGGPGSKTIDVWLPSAKCGLVIGKGGENIKRVSEEFNVKLFVATDIMDIEGIEHKPLKITGEPDKIEQAKKYVLETLLKTGGMPPSARTSGSSYGDYGSQTSNEVVYHAPHDKAGVIIGKGGESIKEINRKSGAYVELDKNYIPPVGNSSDRIFKLRGTPEQIATAQQLMYEKIANSPGGPGDMLTPQQFQQQYNLPAVSSSATDPWNAAPDPYATDPSAAAAAAATDPYSQWASAYGQWPQMNPYGDGASTTGSSSTSTDPSGMDPAWLAYYQSMSYYSMMQASMTSSTASTSTTTTTTTTDSTATNNGSSTAATGQPDYSKQWIEYYRSLGQNEYADQIEQQMKAAAASGSTVAASTSNTTNPWAAYAQQIANGSNGVDSKTNGSSSSTS